MSDDRVVKDGADLQIVPNELVHERTQGCWNCKHFANIATDRETLTSAWAYHKTGLLNRIRQSSLHTRQALLADNDALREIKHLEKFGGSRETAIDMVARNRAGNDPRVGFIEKLADDIESGKLGMCQRPGGPVLERGKEATDFNYSAFLCSGWSAAEGASVARAGQKADMLPGELRERVEEGLPDAKKGG